MDHDVGLPLWPTAARMARALGGRVYPFDTGMPDRWACVVVEGRLSDDPRLDVMAATTLPSPVAPDADRSCPLLWLEWDRPGPGPAAPLVFHATSTRLIGRRGGSPPRVRDILRGIGIDPRPALEVARAAGGPHALLHVASLGPRGRDATRLVFRVPRRALPGWLRAIGWPGDVAAACRVAWAVVPPLRELGVQLELEGGRVGPYLGLELSDFRDARVARCEGPPLVDGVARYADVDRKRVAALLTWPGTDPDGGARHAYIKLALRDGSWHAKLYLGVQSADAVGAMRRGSRR